MNLKKYDGKTVKIVDLNDQVIYGQVIDYIVLEDNEPQEKSLIVVSLDAEWLEFREKTIKEIEIVH